MDPNQKQCPDSPLHSMDVTEDEYLKKSSAKVDDVVDLSDEGSSSSPVSSEDDDVIPLPRRLREKETNMKEPDVIDLTGEEEQDDDVMITDEPTPSGNFEEMPELIEVEPVRAQDLAEDHKKKGNEFFKSQDYYQALTHYTKAIELMPTEASYFGNRSACYMMIKHYKEALVDIRRSLEIDPKYEKGYIRLIRSTLVLGNVKECELAFETCARLGIDVGASSEHERLIWLKGQLVEVEATKTKKDYRKLVFLTSQCLDVASADNQLKMIKADALVRIGRHAEAQELCTEVLTNDIRCPEALYMRAMCLYLDDNLDKSVTFVRQCLQYAPDNQAFQALHKQLKAVKDLRANGSTKFASFKYEEAKQDYLKCLALITGGEMDNLSIQSKIYFNLALIFSKQGKIDESITFCNKAILINSDYLKAILHRAKQQTLKENYDDSIHDYEAALRIDPSLHAVKRELQNVKLLAKKAKRKDYYKILNVDKNASEDEIRKAYKKRALLHHPDRHASAPESVQKEQEKLFKDLGEAYDVLSDHKKKSKYDAGHDLMDDCMNGGGYSQYPDGSDFFNIYFAGNGGPSFRPGPTGGRGGPHHQFHHSFRH